MKKERKGGALAKLAGILCGNPEFWRMVESQTLAPCRSPEDARRYVLEMCGIMSRAQLDHEPSAEGKFHVAVRMPWIRWQQGVRTHQ